MEILPYVLRQRHGHTRLYQKGKGASANKTQEQTLGSEGIDASGALCRVPTGHGGLRGVQGAQPPPPKWSYGLGRPCVRGLLANPRSL